jgi:hypothetical protein
MEYVTLVDSNIDAEKIWEDLYPVLEKNNLLEVSQVSLTSVAGNSWTESIGRIADLKFPEKYFSTINHDLKGTELDRTISKYPNFYRWRLLRLSPKTTYSIHKDSLDNFQTNLRLHIPIDSNDQSFLCFFDQVPAAGKSVSVRYEHLKVGNSYEVNTSGLHTAVNYGNTHRYHIVGVRYENSNNRT